MTDPLGLIGRAGGVQPAHFQRPAVAGPQTGPSFKQVLMENIAEVNRLQQDAEKAIADLAGGRRGDMTQVMLAKQKADTAFQTLLQVRSRLQEAYEEVKQIRV